MGLIKRGIGGALGVVALLVCVGVPTASAAKYSLIAQMPAKNGQTIGVEVKENRALVVASEGAKRSSFSAAFYFYKELRGALKPDGTVDVELGEQGSVHAKFVESRGASDRGESCSHEQINAGFLVGKIILKGGPGVPTLRRKRIPAELRKRRREECRPSPSPRRRDVSLLACNQDADAVYAAGFENGRRGAAIHYAVKGEKPSENVVVNRVAFAFDAPPGTFDVTSDLLGATVRPPKPFVGSATFADVNLTGDLSVRFLGIRKPVPITPASALIDDGDPQTDEGLGCRVPGAGIVGSGAGLARPFGLGR